ncbi:c-type cytochrome [Caballeronia sp. LZ035]|nr:c-type cytochrome [Caballeronia sp. LZ035]MDR5756551.1 c-type cytochrome [Caballeronia sp. LZ035]
MAALGTAHAADISNGKALSDSHNCAACHGPGLNKPVSGEYPRLAGQHATYIYWALRQYQIGGNNPNFGRNNAIMSAQVQSLSPSDLKDLAAYIESLDGSLVLKK